MTDPSFAKASTEVTWRIKAPRQAVYDAFLDGEVVAAWQHPDDMRLLVHSFDPCEGGAFRISLIYQDAEQSPSGKTSENTDTYHGRFLRLIPFTTIVQVVEFESEKEEFAGEMRITVRLADVDGGTVVTYRCEDIPAGVRPEDNIVGCRMSLARLAALLEQPSATPEPTGSGA